MKTFAIFLEENTACLKNGKKSQDPELYSKYKGLRNSLSNQLKYAKQNFFSSFLDNDSPSKRFWGYCKSRSCQSSIPDSIVHNNIICQLPCRYRQCFQLFLFGAFQPCWCLQCSYSSLWCYFFSIWVAPVMKSNPLSASLKTTLRQRLMESPARCWNILPLPSLLSCAAFLIYRCPREGFLMLGNRLG